MTRWLCALLGITSMLAAAQVPPTAAERARYDGLFAAADRGDVAALEQALRAGARVDARDDYQRTPLHVAAYARRTDAMRALVAAGADPNALERDRYDIVTIAAVADDERTLAAALALGCSARNVTSRYDGTALIAAAHLGHVEVVRRLIAAGAPLDHVNNLGWTALIESIVLGDGGARHTATLRALVDAGADVPGDGGARHTATLRALVDAGADVNLADRGGHTPLALARARGYDAMVAVLERAGAR